MSRKQITRKWEIFAGRNKFYCNGRVMTAPHSGVFLFTVTLITVTSTLFFIYDCTYLAVNVTIAIPIIGALLFLFTMSALLRTSLTDPGIIPRATPDEAAYVEKQIEVTNSANSPTYRPPPRTKEVLVKGQTVKLKYCFTCKIFRPPRASHCSLCDNCVDRFDHHCPWVGNCVGRRNYRFFYMFIVSLAFLAVFIFFCAITHLVLISKEDGEFLEAIRQSPASIVVASVCFISVWSVLGLAGFHTYLATTDQTTNEDIKGSFASKRGQDSFNPYSKGNVCWNCFHILCGPLTPSLIDRRGIATAEYRLEVARAPQMTMGMRMEDPVVPVNAMMHHTVVEQITASGTAPYPVQQMALPHTPETRIYRQTTENTESNAGSVTHLVSTDHTVGIAPPIGAPLTDYHHHHQNALHNYYASQPCLDVVGSVQSSVLPAATGVATSSHNSCNDSPLYSNIQSTTTSTVALVTANGTGVMMSEPSYANTTTADSHRNVSNGAALPLSSSATLTKSRSVADCLRDAAVASSVASPTATAATVPSVVRITNSNSTGAVGSSSYVDDLDLDTTDLHVGGGAGGSSTSAATTLAQIRQRLERHENNDLSAQDKENMLLCVSRLKLLRDTTMIASDLDLDSLDDSSIGNNSQAGLMKVVV